jgi:hypothetical protein
MDGHTWRRQLAVPPLPPAPARARSCSSRSPLLAVLHRPQLDLFKVWTLSLSSTPLAHPSEHTARLEPPRRVPQIGCPCAPLALSLSNRPRVLSLFLAARARGATQICSASSK